MKGEVYKPIYLERRNNFWARSPSPPSEKDVRLNTANTGYQTPADNTRLNQIRKELSTLQTPSLGEIFEVNKTKIKENPRLEEKASIVLSFTETVINVAKITGFTIAPHIELLVAGAHLALEGTKKFKEKHEPVIPKQKAA